MVKCDNSVLLHTLMNLLVTYWKEDDLEPPTVLPPAKLSQEVRDEHVPPKFDRASPSNPC